jgi:hypothetical protein
VIPFVDGGSAGVDEREDQAEAPARKYTMVKPTSARKRLVSDSATAIRILG